MKKLTQAEEKRRKKVGYVLDVAVHSIWTQIGLAFVLVGLIAIPEIYYDTKPNLFLIIPIGILFSFLLVINLRVAKYI